jgi:hypothetical protein
MLVFGNRAMAQLVLVKSVFKNKWFCGNYDFNNNFNT